MIKNRYFTFQCIGDSCVVDWEESFLMGEVIAEIVDCELSKLIRIYRPSRLVMSFSRVNGISSSVVGRFMKIQKELQRSRGRMGFIAVSSTMQEVFRRLNLLGTCFELFEDLDSALNQPYQLPDRAYRCRRHANG